MMIKPFLNEPLLGLGRVQRASLWSLGGLAAAGLVAALWLPAPAQAQAVKPTPLLDAIAGQRPVVTGPTISQPTARRAAARSTSDAVDPTDPEDLVPDEPPEEPLAGDNEPVVTEAEGESLELDNSGAIDGIYQCQYPFGNQMFNTFVSVNGKGDGTSIFVIANTADNSLAMSGWGIGQVVNVDGLGYAFVGDTDNQIPFELAVVVDAQGNAVAEGTVGFDVKGNKMLVDITCRSIW